MSSQGPYEKRWRETGHRREKEGPCGHRSRDWSDVITARNAGSRQRLEEARNRLFPQSLQQEHGPRLWASGTDARLLASRTVREEASLVLSRCI